MATQVMANGVLIWAADIVSVEQHFSPDGSSYYLQANYADGTNLQTGSVPNGSELQAMPVTNPPADNWFNMLPTSNQMIASGIIPFKTYNPESIAQQVEDVCTYPSDSAQNANVGIASPPPPSANVPPTTPAGTYSTQVNTYEDPISGKTVATAPLSAGLVDGALSTTSQQSGCNPGPTPPIGTMSPAALQSLALPVSPVAPDGVKSTWTTFAIIFAVIIGLWMFAGFSVRRAME